MEVLSSYKNIKIERTGEKKMVKHVILWQLKDELTAEEKVTIKKEMKESLEALVGKIPGLVEMKI